MEIWRITKYNPLFRNEKGVFLRDDWTSVADIGKSSQSNHGQPITVEEYLAVEDAYVGAIQAFLEELDLPSLQVSHLENAQREREIQRMKQEREMYPMLHREEMLSRFLALEDGQFIQRTDLAPLCRLILREYVWCKLKAGSSLFVHFGRDYYMYIGAAIACTHALAHVRQSGLFAEPIVASPYSEM
ncbi:MAG TPA: hypothetical protein VL485_27740 [Ktedonobacteraceae bacterium]|jgi:hypothetical protein|nr:hypothetical protein [Ktedonobacteraceae bacterium]